jgi:hypothetical protein
MATICTSQTSQKNHTYHSLNTKRWLQLEQLIDMKHFLHDMSIPVLYGASCHYCIRGSSSMDPHILNLCTRHKWLTSSPCNCTPSTKSTGSCVSCIRCPYALLCPELQVRHVYLCLCTVTFELHPTPPLWLQERSSRWHVEKQHLLPTKDWDKSGVPAS